MLSEKEKDELLNELEESTECIDGIRNNLNKANKNKDVAFKKKDDISKSISEKISSVKKLKEERNKLTAEVKELKDQRAKLNKEIKNRVGGIKGLSKEKEDISDEKGHRLSPKRIRGMMDKLEEKIETEVLSFEKEKGMMKRINELRNQYGEAKKADIVYRKIKDDEKLANELRKNSGKIHRKLQGTARKSQEKHEEMIKISAEIDLLRKGEGEAYREFFKIRKEFVEVHKSFKSKLDQIKKINAKLSKHNIEVKKQEKQEVETILKKKEDVIKDKIKKGGKLTTEDLLVLQRE